MHDLLNHLPIPFGLIVALLAFLFLWRGIMRVLRRVSRMTDTVPADAGPAVRKSGYGNAVINGARATNCVRVVEYAGGHAVQMHPIFGGGLVWLPRNATTQQRDGASATVLTHGRHVVQLSGRLAEFMTGAAAGTTTAHAHPTHVHRTTPEPDHTQATALAIGLQRLPRGGGGSGLSRAAIGLAIALLLYVLVRRTSPELLAPLERLVADLIRGL
ncbi:MAG: hypothetical protein DWQ11_01275 [Proteobacteria bacterium]|nr:MAG: hypothetical protein DWQ11_01275 [Pseudomonadota bacterium]